MARMEDVHPTNLMAHLPADQLEYKYLNEIHANEVEILPQHPQATTSPT